MAETRTRRRDMAVPLDVLRKAAEDGEHGIMWVDKDQVLDLLDTIERLSRRATVPEHTKTCRVYVPEEGGFCTCVAEKSATSATKADIVDVLHAYTEQLHSGIVQRDFAVVSRAHLREAADEIVRLREAAHHLIYGHGCDCAGLRPVRSLITADPTSDEAQDEAGRIGASATRHAIATDADERPKMQDARDRERGSWHYLQEGEGCRDYGCTPYARSEVKE